jgi:hypothetical protein
MRDWRAWCLCGLVAAAAALVLSGLVGGGAGLSGGSATAEFRPVDRDRYLRRVQEGTLSDREARWWHPAEEGPAP